MIVLLLQIYTFSFTHIDLCHVCTCFCMHRQTELETYFNTVMSSAHKFCMKVPWALFARTDIRVRINRLLWVNSLSLHVTLSRICIQASSLSCAVVYEYMYLDIYTHRCPVTGQKLTQCRWIRLYCTSQDYDSESVPTTRRAIWVALCFCTKFGNILSQQP